MGSEMCIRDGADDASFHEALRTRHVRALHSREADLAEVFASVTGRELS